MSNIEVKLTISVLQRPMHLMCSRPHVFWPDGPLVRQAITNSNTPKRPMTATAEIKTQNNVPVLSNTNKERNIINTIVPMANMGVGGGVVVLVVVRGACEQCWSFVGYDWVDCREQDPWQLIFDNWGQLISPPPVPLQWWREWYKVIHKKVMHEKVP